MKIESNSIPVLERDPLLSESLTELLRETKNLTVNVYLGDSYYDTVKVFGGEDYSTINLPYRTDAEEIFEKEGIEIR